MKTPNTIHLVPQQAIDRDDQQHESLKLNKATTPTVGCATPPTTIPPPPTIQPYLPITHPFLHPKRHGATVGQVSRPGSSGTSYAPPQLVLDRSQLMLNLMNSGYPSQPGLTPTEHPTLPVSWTVLLDCPRNVPERTSRSRPTHDGLLPPFPLPALPNKIRYTFLRSSSGLHPFTASFPLRTSKGLRRLISRTSSVDHTLLSSADSGKPTSTCIHGRPPPLPLAATAVPVRRGAYGLLALEGFVRLMLDKSSDLRNRCSMSSVSCKRHDVEPPLP